MLSYETLTVPQKAALWRSGNIFYLLHAGQLEVYKKFRAWEKSGLEARQNGIVLPGEFPRVFVFDCARRFGKDYLSSVIAIENAIKRPKSVQTYATAFQKDVNDVVIPLFSQITEDCPEGLRPSFHTAKGGLVNGFHFPNGSIIKLVGVETRPDSLRGRFSDGFFFSEAAFIGKLEETLRRVVYPQLQGRLGASILMNSTPPVEPAHFWDTHICPDAQGRGAYTLKTIDDNPRLSQTEKDEFIRGAGGAQHENNLRENYCVRIRSATSTVVPEFSRATHVRAEESGDEPQYAIGVTVIDPGIRDLCAVSCGYYDFERAKLVIRNSWDKRNANTNEVAKAIRELERQTFRDQKFWKDRKFQDNPWMRFSDTEARLIGDLSKLYGLEVVNVDKSQGKEAALHNFRSSVQKGQIEWHPDAERSIASVEAAVWNKERSDWARAPEFGHYDQLDVAIYMWIMCNRIDNPFPPSGVVLGQHISQDNLHAPAHTLDRKRKISEAFEKLWPGSRKFKTSGRR